jgi:hypothetical protein
MLKQSHEDWLAELDDILRRYRCGSPTDPKARSADWSDAIERLEKLGFSTGEAMHVLRGKQPAAVGGVTVKRVSAREALALHKARLCARADRA